MEMVSNRSIKDALKEEIENSPEWCSTERCGRMKAIVVLVDMGWQKRAAGRSYNSPSGVLHAVGGKTGKIIQTFVYCNRCQKCLLQEGLGRHLKMLDEISDRDEYIEIKDKMKQNENHDCLKNFDGPSKSMEMDAIVQLIKMAPEKMGCYIRTICLDNYMITRSHIQADLGPKSKGFLPFDLAGI